MAIVLLWSLLQLQAHIHPEGSVFTRSSSACQEVWIMLWKPSALTPVLSASSISNGISVFSKLHSFLNPEKCHSQTFPFSLFHPILSLVRIIDTSCFISQQSQFHWLNTAKTYVSFSQSLGRIWLPSIILKWCSPECNIQRHWVRERVMEKTHQLLLASTKSFMSHPLRAHRQK